jgi:hypothetical protein
MADQLKMRGGPTAQSETFVGAEREITVDTGLKRLRIHDGVTPGGHLLTGKVDLDAAVALINQTINDNEAADAQARADLKVLLEQELADLAALEAADKVALQADIDAEAQASAAYDIQQDNRLAVLEVVNEISKKELNYITLVGTASPAPGQVGVTSFTPSEIFMIVLPKTDADGKTVTASDFLQGDRIGLKQSNGSAGIFFVSSAFDFGDHIRINVDDSATVLGAAGDLAFIENDSIEAIFEDTSVTRAAATAGFTAASDARAVLQGLIDALEVRTTALETATTSNDTDIVDGDAATLASANAYTDTAITNLTNGADAALDTLKEIGDALAAGDQSVTDALTTSITTESTTRAAADTALSDRLDVLEADPTTQTLLNAEGVARAAAVEAEATARVAADAATLTSANSYTDTQVASGDTAVTNAMTALVTTETAARGAADSALSARIDVLEADPTTATALTAAVAGVQADVDQNEADSDAAIAAEETRALAAEASITATHTADEAARNQLNLHAGLAFGQLYVGDLVVA